MAKGQKRSNREVRKPKQDKGPAAATPVSAAGQAFATKSWKSSGKKA